MSTGAMVAEPADNANAKVSIVEQYTAIRARQRELTSAEGSVPPTASTSTTVTCSYGIWVWHGRRRWLVSWLPSAASVMLTTNPTAAMRFGSKQTAAAMVEHVPALRDKARRDEAGIVEVHRSYRGIPLFGARDECRLSAAATGRPTEFSAPVTGSEGAGRLANLAFGETPPSSRYTLPSAIDGRDPSCANPR